MTSKISSYIKLIRSDIRHRGWLAALSCTLFFLLMPVYTMLYLSTYTDRTCENSSSIFPDCSTADTQRYLAAAIAGLAVPICPDRFQLHPLKREDGLRPLSARKAHGVVWNDLPVRPADRTHPVCGLQHPDSMVQQEQRAKA